MGDLVIREARDSDEQGLIELIGGCFDEYPGCVLDVDGEIPELRAIRTHFVDHWGGEFWTAEREGRVVGCIGHTPAKLAGGIELKKLYVDKTERRARLGWRLADLVEDAARARGAAFIDLWSDTRFEAAHAFYRRRGYVQTGETRDLRDKSGTIEYYFRLELDEGVRPSP